MKKTFIFANYASLQVVRSNKQYQGGFTLAEVLITLGIIGVVAAMTIPSLIQGYKKSEASSRLKKFVSTFNQAIIFAENDYGPHRDWILEDANSSESAYTFLTTYIKPYTKYLAIEKSNFNGLNTATMKFLDGSVVYVKLGGCYDIYYDINGEKLPNKNGRDIFTFIMCRYPGECSIGPSFRSYYCNPFPPTEQREVMIENCKRDPELSCTMLLENDQWEFKKDYPVKL